MKIFSFILFFLMVGCATNTHIPENGEIELYLNNMEFREPANEYRHADYGVMKADKEPLKSDLSDCENKAFRGVSVNLGDQKISDPLVMFELHIDYSYYDISRRLRRKPDLTTEYKIAKYSVMRSVYIQPALKKIRNLIGERNLCIKEKGWVSTIYD